MDRTSIADNDEMHLSSHNVVNVTNFNSNVQQQQSMRATDYSNRSGLSGANNKQPW